jgi:elongation factor G
LTEAVALTDDALLDHYLEFLDLPDQALSEGLAKAVQLRAVTPVVFCSATQVVGIQHVIDAVRDALPASNEAAGTLLSATGETCAASADGPFVAQVLATALDDQGQPYAVCRIRSGAASRKTAWTSFGEARGRRVNKLYQLRGSRRKVARKAPTGSVVATWDLTGVSAGDFLSATGMWRMDMPAKASREEAVWLVPESASDERRLDAALTVLCQVDGALQVRRDTLTDGVVLAGLSKLQLAMAAERLAALGVQVTTRDVPIGYREVPAAIVRGVAGVHQRMDSYDDIVEYGHVVVDVVPTAPDTPLHFVADCDPNELPASFHAAVAEGARLALGSGPLAGYPVTGVKVVLTGGGYNAIFTTEEHVVYAAEKAVRSALERTRTALVEPWLNAALTVSPDHVGACLAATGAHRGRIAGVESGAEWTVITVSVPEREWRRMREQLSSVTAGTATVKTEFDHYEDVPSNDTRQLIGTSPVSPHRARQTASSLDAVSWRALARTR